MLKTLRKHILTMTEKAPVEFEVIEQQKENIEPLKEGRSASALKELFTIPHHQLKAQQLEERSRIEDQLRNIDDLDDPIQPYLDYIEWTTRNFPSGVTVESGLVQVLERCTSHFRDAPFYKNDPRYLRVWMNYARYSENPRDIFVYLARKEIGSTLATYYEEYANFLESNERNLQADQVYQEGIKQQARPLPRLERRYQEFKERLQKKENLNEEPQSPVFPSRAALSVKSGTLFALHEEKRTLKRKIDIFSDPDGSPSELRSNGWDKLGSSTFRNKENKLEAKPWAGETMPQEKKPRHSFGKIAVFKDDLLHNDPVYKIIETPGKKTEKVDLNFDLLYQESGEFCIQEVLAMMRHTTRQAPQLESPKFEPLVQKSPLVPSVAPRVLSPEKNITIHLNTSALKKQASPTATMFTKEAKDEIYSMFNQSNEPKDENVGNYDDDAGDDRLVYEGITEQIRTTKQNLGDLTEKVSDLELLSRLEDEELLRTECVVNPGDETLKSALLTELSPSLKSYDGVYQYDCPMEMINTLKKSLNLKQSKNVFLGFDANGNTFDLKRLLGEGGYASVYLAEGMDGHFKAIKAQRPSSAWEFYILKKIENRLSGQEVLNSIIHADEIHLYQDESYLILDYLKQGTILDVVNFYRTSGKNMDEVLVVYLTCELLKTIQSLHNVGIIHGDLKPDNCMIRLNDANSVSTSSKDWKLRGLKVIDFGRSIDMSLFPKNVTFKSNWKTDNQDCPEMRKNKSWTYQIDYFGVAGIIHTMLYGTFIETAETSDGFHKLNNPMKRYWQKEIWSPLFDLLMNSTKFGQLPIFNELDRQIVKLEGWLDENDGNLLSIIRDIETGLN